MHPGLEAASLFASPVGTTALLKPIKGHFSQQQRTVAQSPDPRLNVRYSKGVTAPQVESERQKRKAPELPPSTQARGLAPVGKKAAIGRGDMVARGGGSNMPMSDDPMSNAQSASTSRSGSPDKNSKEDKKLDVNLYSRQIGAFGLETMGKLMKLRVLVSGLTGLGVEIAKNLVLAGPAVVGVHDDSVAVIEDLCSNFYLSESDVQNKRKRGACCAPRLADLNDYVSVDLIEGALTAEVIANFDVVVVTDVPRKELIRINKLCRSRKPQVGFIAADQFGLAGVVFVDFGKSFTVYDPDGETVKTAIIEGVVHDAGSTIVNLNQDTLCPFSVGTCVRFREIEGMDQLNHLDRPVEITQTGKHHFVIADQSAKAPGPYLRNGIVEEVKIAKSMSFAPLEESILKPLPPDASCLPMPDLSKFQRSEQLHVAMQALYEYWDQHGQLPPPRDEGAVEQCHSFAQKLQQLMKEETERQGVSAVDGQWKSFIVEDLDKEKVLANVVRFARCRITPMSAFLGGVVAQEVVKFLGKFTPLHQFLYFDAFECLPPQDPADTAPLRQRFDPQIAIWGAAFQKKLAALRMFLVGAGALGCEYLKSLALMGCCQGDAGGSLTVTDMDRIELSNLNRQFLFRREHVGQPKSRVASEAARSINPQINIVTKEVRVGAETEDVFDDDFWGSLDVVINALDNVPSRLYIDSRCVWFHKPLLESGTLGTKANVQVVIPNMTQSYGDSQDPPEDAIPLCTLRHFPNQIEHTIEWARDAFQGLYGDGPRQAAACLENPALFLKKLTAEGGSASTQREQLEKVTSLLTALREQPTFDVCVQKSVEFFVKNFDHQIAQLLFNFPLDHVTSSGVPFWSGPKRAPQVIPFDPQDPLHLNFVHAAANLLAYTLGLKQVHDIEVTRSYAARVAIPSFKPREVKIKVDDTDTTQEGCSDDEFICEGLKKRLVNELVPSISGRTVHPIEFEKDDDTNFHIDFIAACGNLRARNYRIPECDQHKAKMIAGRIIPAIATTTAMATGLASLELLKFVNLEERKIDDFRDAFVNLALPLFILSEPSPPLRTKDKDYDPIVGGPVKARPNGFSTWDVLEVVLPDATLQELIDEVEKRVEGEVSILSVGNACLYNTFLKSHRDRLPKRVKELAETLLKISFPPKRKYIAIEASCSDKDDGVDIAIPTIKYIF